MRQELVEEIALEATMVSRLEVAYPFEVNDPSISRTWVIYAALAVVSERPPIVLDWEHTDYAWILPEELKNYSYVKGFDKIVTTALKLL